jgi:hypothetical protein
VIIGLNGKLESGKDTSYALIKELCEEDPGMLVAVRDAFADRLKKSAVAALGLDDSDSIAEAVAIANQLKEHGKIAVYYENDDGPSHIITGREYLQFYGTEAHRDVFDQDFWINAVIPSFDDHYYGRKDLAELVQDGFNPILVITDCRFQNEAEAVRFAGGKVWEIQRPSATLKEDAHASEKRLPEELIDVTIINDGSIADLKESLRVHLNKLLS